MNIIESTLERFSRWLGWLASAALVGMMLLVVLNVFVRVIYKPILGTYEIVGFLGVVIISFGIAHTTIKRGHVAVDLFVSCFKKKTQHVIRAFSACLGSLLFILMSWQSARYALELAKNGLLSQTLKIPYYPIVYGLSVACALTSMVLALEAAKSIRSVWGK